MLRLTSLFPRQVSLSLRLHTMAHTQPRRLPEWSALCFISPELSAHAAWAVLQLGSSRGAVLEPYLTSQN